MWTTEDVHVWPEGRSLLLVQGVQSKEYGDTLKLSGLIQGRNNPCLLLNKEFEVFIMVHGDDFIAVGSGKDLKATRAILENKCKI